MHVNQRLIVPSQGLNESPVLQMGVYVISIELQGELVLFFRFSPVPIVLQSLSQRKMSFRKGRIQLQCRGGRLFSLRQGLLRGMTSPNRVPQLDMGIGESRVCLGIGRVLVDGRFEICNRCLNVLVSVFPFPRKFGKAAQTASQYGAAAKIIGVGLGANRSSAGQPSTLLRGQLDLYFIRDAACNVILYAQNITSVAIIFMGPELTLRRSLRQMDGYPHPVFRACDSSF